MGRRTCPSPLTPGWQETRSICSALLLRHRLPKVAASKIHSQLLKNHPSISDLDLEEESGEFVGALLALGELPHWRGCQAQSRRLRRFRDRPYVLLPFEVLLLLLACRVVKAVRVVDDRHLGVVLGVVAGADPRVPTVADQAQRRLKALSQQLRNSSSLFGLMISILGEWRWHNLLGKLTLGVVR